MFNTILVPTDGSELADKAVTAAIAFANEYKSKLIGLAVAEPWPYSPFAEPAFLPDRATYEKSTQETAETNVRKVAEAAQKAGVSCETLTAMSVDPSEDIIRVAKDKQCDVIFIASHGRRGLDRILLGSVTQKVLVNSKIPVLVFR